MRRLLTALLLLMSCVTLWAADNAVILTPGTGVTMRTVDVGAGVQSSAVILGSTAGAAIYGTAGTANANVLTIQGIASGTVVPVSGTLTAVTTVSTVTNLAQMNGAVLLMGNGVTGTGSQRVTIASDNTAFSVNVANANANGQATMANSSPVVIASNQTANALWGHGATGSAVPANAVYGGVNVGGNLAGIVGDPCQTVAKTYTPIIITTATTTRIVAPTSAKKTYICHIILTSAAADNVGIVEGTGGTCASGTVGVIGGATAVNGPNFAANGGVSLGSGGYAIAATAGTNVDLCLITSAATPLAGHIVWVQQ